jgi:hypothetical protein
MQRYQEEGDDREDQNVIRDVLIIYAVEEVDVGAVAR